MERLLVSDQALWTRFPTAAGALLWPLQIVLLGWGTGWWTGAATVILLGVASVIGPPRLAVSVYLVDLLEGMLRLPLFLGWLLATWYLWLREPLFPLLGQPLVGAILITALLWATTRVLALLSRFATRRVFRPLTGGGE